MSKRNDAFVREYIAKLSDDNIKFLLSRLSQRLSGDLPEALDFVSQHSEINNWLYGLKTAWELYDAIDLLYKYVEREHDYRFADAA